MSKTVYDKIWDKHVVSRSDDGTTLLYIDRHLVHEVTSPQAFEGLRMANRKPWRAASVLAVPDHNVPTTDRDAGVTDPISRKQIETLDQNCSDFDLVEFGMNDDRQGVVHVIGPEQGFTLPGTTLVCGDSHTSTHGAFAALAFGVGTSEVEHVLATQCLLQRKSKNMLVRFNGMPAEGVSAKDVILALIGQIGTAGGTGHTIEFGGDLIRSYSMESRMTICNMSIEAGARAGLIAVDDVTLDYLKGRPMAPKGEMWDKAVESWRELTSDSDDAFDTIIDVDVSELAPQVTWGTSPEMVTGVNGRVPDPNDAEDAVRRTSIEAALDYMGLQPGDSISDIAIDKVFIGSCTNARIEDLRRAAAVAKGKQVAGNVKQAMVVPGSTQVRKQAEQEGLAAIFEAAGFEWRQSGCSMCLAMNADQLLPQERCASTSNRNFEGRQGRGGRTHLVSPEMAAAAAITGKFTDVRELLNSPVTTN